MYFIFLGVDDLGQVVAIGTGRICPSFGVHMGDGRTIKDLHAEVIARRALQK